MSAFAALKQFTVQDDGATAIEYGLIAALVGVALISALAMMGDSLADVFTTTSTTINDALPEE